MKCLKYMRRVNVNKTLVSVIVPVYNIQDYVLRCLESISNQSYKDIEIIVVDDGATDKSGEICDEFARKDKRAKVFHKKNVGLSDARNYGIKKARGEIIALVDGDDFVKADYIKAMYEAMTKNDADVVICGYNEMAPKEQTISGEEATKKLLVEQENLEIVAWNKLYKKSLFIKNSILYPVGEKHEDALTTYKVLAAAKSVSYVPKSFYHYVTREDSIMGQGDVLGRIKMRERAAEEAVKYFAKNPELIQAAWVAVLTSKYAYMDAATRGEIDKKYYKINADWVRKNSKKYKNNKLLTSKLKLYNFLIKVNLYKAFRTII